MPAETSELPVLYQLEISHYNEKARWALDYKRVAHRRRSLLPGPHIRITHRLTGGECETTPVLTLDGVSIGDSAAILEALERRHPEPPLVPADPELRARALELSRWFDDEVGPHLRRAVYFDLLPRMDLLRPVFAHGQPPAARALLALYAPLLRPVMSRHFAVDPATAADSRARVAQAVDRIESELDAGGGDYLVGDRFTIADLTAAALLYPIGRPEQFPYPIPEPPPGPALAMLEELADRRGGRWVSEMYARHRTAV